MTNRTVNSVHEVPVNSQASVGGISVVIPAYNGEKFLPATLESVFSQTLQPMEIIVVDDGSTDSTPALLRQYAGRVTYIRKVNRGPAAARNTGIVAAKGEWIALLDQDDSWVPKKLEKQIEHAIKCRADFVCCDAALDKGAGPYASWWEATGHLAKLRGLDWEQCLPDPANELMHKGCFILTSTVLARRQALIDVGLFDEELRGTDDFDFWIRWSLSHSLSVMRATYVQRGVHQNNLSSHSKVFLPAVTALWAKLENHAAIKSNPKWAGLARANKAKAAWEEGYWHFLANDFPAARQCWRNGLRSKFSLKHGLYWLLTWLPSGWIRCLQAVAAAVRKEQRNSNFEAGDVKASQPTGLSDVRPSIPTRTEIL